MTCSGTPSPVVEELAVPIPSSTSFHFGISYLTSFVFYLSIIATVYLLYGIVEYGFVSFHENYLLGVSIDNYFNVGMLNWIQQEPVEHVNFLLPIHI